MKQFDYLCRARLSHRGPIPVRAFFPSPQQRTRRSWDVTAIPHLEPGVSACSQRFYARCPRDLGSPTSDPVHEPAHTCQMMSHLFNRVLELGHMTLGTLPCFLITKEKVPDCALFCTHRDALYLEPSPAQSSSGRVLLFRPRDALNSLSQESVGLPARGSHEPGTETSARPTIPGATAKG